MCGIKYNNYQKDGDYIWKMPHFNNLILMDKIIIYLLSLMDMEVIIFNN